VVKIKTHSQTHQEGQEEHGEDSISCLAFPLSWRL